MSPVLKHIPREESRAAMLSLVVGITLLAMKYTAYFLTGSAAIFSDATESIANVAASIVALVSLGVAHLPADEQHPYGHGKAEFLSAWFEGSMMLLAGLFIIVKTIDAIWHGEYLRPGAADVGLILVIAAALVNLVVGIFLIKTGRKHGSLTLEADGHHLLSDVYSSAGVIFALGLVKLTGQTWLDPVTAFVMAGWIIWLSSTLLRRAAAGLMDKQDAEDDLKIQRILDSHCGASGREPRICNYHKLRHRHSGRYHWVDFHLRLPANVNVRQAHEIASSIEEEIEAAIGEGNATAHVEPCGMDRCGDSGKCFLSQRPADPAA